MTYVPTKLRQPTFLYHPRRDIWKEHFKLLSASIEPQSPTGRVTVNVLHFNDLPRIQQREILIQLERYPCDAAADG
jgi:hypothetical protein